MPGMMDTILNLGLNDEAAEGLAARTGNRALRLRLVPAADPDVRRGRRRHRRRTGSSRRSPTLKAARGVAQDTDLTADDLRELVGDVQGASTARRPARDFPQDAREQLARAVRAVFDSWDTPRAQVYRRAHEIPDDLGTAVNVVQMVFGNKGDDSGTGVVLHARPVDRRAAASTASSSSNAQGEDVVAGIRTPEPLERMREPPARGVRAAARDDAAARASTTATCRTSSSRSRTGELYLLQTRTREADGGGRAEGRGRHGRGGR